MKIINIELGDEVQKRFDDCCAEIVEVMNKHLPEVREAWELCDPGSFVKRVFMSVYMEMIHAGFFDNG